MKHEHPDKIIFLDIDGPINTVRSLFTQFDPICMKYLEDILDATGAKIVLSSSWRGRDMVDTKTRLKEHGCTDKILDAIIDLTVWGHDYMKPKTRFPIVRGNEIKQWVDDHLKYPWYANPTCDSHYRQNNPDGSFKMLDHNIKGKDYSYVILDDDTDMLYDQRNNFIITEPELGLTKAHVQEAIKILNYITKG